MKEVKSSVIVANFNIIKIEYNFFLGNSNKSLAYLMKANQKVNRTTRLYMKYCVDGIMLNIVIGCLACILLSLAFEGRIDSNYFIYPGRYM